VATALLGLTSYVAPFSTGFLQHPNEALFLLWTFYFLFADRQRPDWRARLWAGVAAGVMLQSRFPAAVALPGLAFYLLASVWRRRPVDSTLGRYLPSALRQIVPFAAAVAASLVVHLAVNYIKLGTLTLAGGYAGKPFNTPLLTGLYGFLLSPGQSVFLFTPLLVLVPWTLRHLNRQYPDEVRLILFLVVCYLLFYGKVELWHGMWAFGPRYLVPLVPLLLLPLATWLENVGWRGRLAVIPLAAIGAWVQLVHVAVNFWSVAVHEKYVDFQPPYGFLFIPELSPVLAHSRALLAGDGRVDFWLLHVYRRVGADYAAALGLPLLILLVLCVWKLARSFRAVEAAAAPPTDARFSGHLRPAIALLLCLVVGTGLGMGFDDGHRASSAAAAADEVPLSPDASQESLMWLGVDALYDRRDPMRAAVLFRKVLERNPRHYGATFQLAMALDAADRKAEARPFWEAALRMAESSKDESTAATARARLATRP
jgi:Dolichyl-phosphate-mannose-protein mannosyltransferase